MARANIELVSAWLRIWNDDTAVYGEPFDFFVGVRWLSRDHVEICGLRTESGAAFTMSHALAIRRELAVYGVKKYQFKRFKHGRDSIVCGRVPQVK